MWRNFYFALNFSSTESGAEWLSWLTVDWWQSQQSRRFGTSPPCLSFTKMTSPPCRGPTLFRKLTISRHWRTTSSRILSRYISYLCDKCPSLIIYTCYLEVNSTLWGLFYVILWLLSASAYNRKWWGSLCLIQCLQVAWQLFIHSN